MVLSERLRSLRQAQGLSQEAVARRADMGLRGYSDLERGVATDPHYSTLAAIAQALGTTVAELVGEETAAPKASAPPSEATTGLEFEGWPFDIRTAYWIETLNAQAALTERIIDQGGYDLRTIADVEGIAVELWGAYSRTVRRSVWEWCMETQREELERAEARMREARSTARRAYQERRAAEKDSKLVDELEPKRREREARYAYAETGA